MGLFCCQVLKSVKKVGVLIFVLKKGLILYQETNTNTHTNMKTIAQQLNFNSVEKVLFKASVDFAIKYEKLSLPEAEQRGIEKVMQKRAMAKNLDFKF